MDKVRSVAYNDDDDDDFVEVGLGERRNVFTWKQPRSGKRGSGGPVGDRRVNYTRLIEGGRSSGAARKACRRERGPVGWIGTRGRSSFRDYGGLRQKTDTWFASVFARVTHSGARGGVCTAPRIGPRPIVFRSEVFEYRSGWAYVIGVADSTARLMVSSRESHPVQ